MVASSPDPSMIRTNPQLEDARDGALGFALRVEVDMRVDVHGYLAAIVARQLLDISIVNYSS